MWPIPSPSGKFTSDDVTQDFTGTAAAELAEKARAGGGLGPEVASYRRQLGVTLTER